MPELTDQQFDEWASLLEQRLGIAVTSQRKAFLSSKLRIRMRALGIEDYQHYYSLVSSPQRGTQEWSRLLDLLTIHETRFNRHPASFRLVEEGYLRPLLQSRAAVLNLRAWSVGCASGEEAYYLAMVMDRVLAAYPGKAYYGVIGSDVSLESLAHARHATYSASRLAELCEETKNTYFEFTTEGYRVVERVKQRVAFSQLNVQGLLQAPFEEVDIIFCQNVLIYFSQEKRREIVSALARFLKPGGMLILGIGELVGWCPDGLETLKFEDTLAYQRAKD